MQISFAQSRDLFRGLPQNSQGYLIWNDDNPDVEYWRIEVTQKNADLSTNPISFPEQTIERHEVWRKNFLKLDKNLWNLNKPGTLNYITLSGLNNSDSVIVSATHVLESDFPQLGAPEFFKGCYWTCVGDNYAYRIQQFKKINNPDMGHYSIQPAYYIDDEETGTRISYFRYFDQPEITNYTNDFKAYAQSGHFLYFDHLYNKDVYDVPINMNPKFHGIQTWSMGPTGDQPYNKNFFKFQQYDNNSNITYKASNGSILTAPTVYALQKSTGWWRIGAIRAPQDEELDITNDCLKSDMAWLMDEFNGPNSGLTWYKENGGVPFPNFPDHPDNVRDLVCNASLGGGAPYLYNNSDYSDCIYGALADFIDANDNFDSYMDYLSAMSDCWDSDQGGSGSNSGGGGRFDEAIAHLEFLSLEYLGPTGDSLVESFVHSELVDSLGNYIQTRNQIIEPGLYRMNWKYPTTTINYIIFETKKPLNSTVPLSYFVDATIFPVPLKDEYTFNINLSTSARSDFIYELLDFHGNTIYRKNFSLEKDHDENHLIVSDVQIPKGILLNRFIFNDGSSFTITTTR